MIAVAQIIRERPATVARTMRESFGVGLSDLGDGLSWGEAKLLIEEAAADTSTHLGADLAGWAYPAGFRDLLSLAAVIGNEKAARKVMPWAMSLKSEVKATPTEVAIAAAQLEDEIIFS